jgi:rhodanese-related sulfurtransferase
MLSMIPSVFAGVDLRDLEKIKAITRKAYPSVPQLSTDMLAEWMKKPEPSLLLVDVRSREEFEVSHLRDARNLQTVKSIAEAVREHKPSKTILYCSVGFRSSRLAHVLAQHGVCNVLNLEGSIFQWANEGRAIYQAENLVRQVHPYGKHWAGLLKDGLASGGGA